MLRSFKLNQRLIIFGVCLLLSLVSLVGVTSPVSAATRLTASPFVYDPTGTHIVQATWAAYQGLPDSTGTKHYALLLTKLGTTSTNAASGATIKNLSSTPLTEIGWDIRNDSHCGAGAPRFNVVTGDNVLHFIGCDSPAPISSAAAPGSPDANGYAWTRDRYDPTQAFPPITPGSKIKSISIVFDEGLDEGDGYAFLDNIDINGTLVGQP